MSETTTYALGGMVEAFPASDGHIYFLRGGTDAEHVLEEPSEVDRRVLELLHRPRSRPELLEVSGAVPRELDELLGALEAIGLLDVGPLDAVGHGLGPEEAARFDRQLPYFAGGVDARVQKQRRLLDATAAFVGCGALGSWTAAGLVCAGVGRLVSSTTTPSSSATSTGSCSSGAPTWAASRWPRPLMP